TKIGKKITVMIDEIQGGQIIARSSADAPEIDGLVYVSNGQGLLPGDLVEVKVTDSDAHDLWAVLVNT
nr:TRAM domain-containing protein [Betaproteobacteria bacterium]